MTDWGLLHLIRCGGSNCEECGLRNPCQRNHCIIHRAKGYEKFLDVPENVEFICQKCHTYPGHTKAHKKEFWYKQIKRGYDMDKWWDSLPKGLTIGRYKPK
jgi:hypothetical protein